MDLQIDGSAVQPDGDEFVPRAALAKTGGVAVLQSELTKADGSGEATLTFTYARSWEASDSDKSVVLHATVENGAFTQVEERRNEGRGNGRAPFPPFLVRNAQMLRSRRSKAATATANSATAPTASVAPPTADASPAARP